MARRKVFICYSHEDRELFERFRTQLDPLMHQDLLEVWTDVEIRVGEDWEPRIYRAIERADAAVVLVSPDLLASDFVRQSEMPRLLQARRERGLELLPLFLRSSTADLVSFPVEGADPVALTDIQGLNTPAEAIAELPPAAQDLTLAAAARALLRLLPAMPEPVARPRRDLTAVLELRDGRIVRRYGQPPWYDLHSGRGRADPRRLRRLAEGTTDEAGRDLFRLLLGGEDERTEVLTKAYGRVVPDPLRHAFRVCIRTADETLRALPWAACRWRDHLLVDEGWTFELAASDRPRPVEHLHTPCRALLVAAEPAGLPPLLADAHTKSLESLFARAWKLPLKADLLHRLRTLADLEAELATPPDILHLYAHAASGDGGLALAFEEGDGGVAWVPFGAVTELFGRRPPQVLVLNTVGDGPLAPALPGVAAVLHLRHADGAGARSAVAAWWEDVLSARRDPVRAFCALPPDVRRRGAVATDYREWTLDHSEYVPKIDRPRAHLDRRDQRRVVLDAVEELVRGGKRRVTCLVAYGAEGNLVEHFGVQMLATLKERATDLARLEPSRIEFPAVRDGLTRGTIEELFRATMRLQPSDPLAAAFRSPRRGGPRAKPVHFLDWGTFGDGHQEPLGLEQLETWLLFCRDDLEGACPPSARILAYLSVVSTEERHPDLAELFKELKLRHHAPHFDLVGLPALGTVEDDDLLRFLEDEHNSSCPPAFVRDLARRIVGFTGGGFERTVRLLEETERGNRWYELDEELPKVAPDGRAKWEGPL